MPRRRGLAGRVYRRAIEESASRTFPLFQRLGVHVLPNRFDQPVPDTRTLPASLWDGRSELVGIDVRRDAQEALMYELAAFRDEIAALPRHATGDPHDFHFDNDRFSGVDAAVLYALVRHLKPHRFIEVGSGFSTLLTALALRRNQADGAQPSEFVAIEPYPLEFLDGLDGLTKLIVQPVQEVPLALFEDLGEGDVLFIDSSHVLKIGSDVQYLFLEVLPRLPKGVIVHVHDIFLPWEYPQEWVMREERFWNEAYLLQAFLTDNRRVEVMLMNCWNFGLGGEGLLSLVGLRPDEVTAGSFWFKYVA